MKQNLILFAMAFICAIVTGQTPKSFAELFGDTRKHGKAIHGGNAYRRLDPTDANAVANKLIEYQNADGGWPKDIDWLDATPADSVLMGLKANKRKSSLENKTTNAHVIYIAQTYETTQDPRHKAAALKGLDYIVNSQMANGGWRDSRFDAIAFNYYIMSETVKVLHLASNRLAPFGWLSRQEAQKISKAYDKALNLVLSTQLRDKDGKLTGWCHHYDKTTLSAREGKAYDQPCVSPAETIRIMEALMTIEHPTEAVRKAVTASHEWLEKSNLKNPANAQQAETFGISAEGGRYIWARSYDIADNSVFFVNDDGSRVTDMSELEFERMLKIGWFGSWNHDVMRSFEEWKERK